MKVSELTKMEIPVNITVDLTLIDDDVKRVFDKRQHSEKDYINQHLNIIRGKYSTINHKLYVIARLDEDIIKIYKRFAISPIKELVEKLAEACEDLQCNYCPYGQHDCLLKHNDIPPYMWTHLLD